MKVNKRLAWLVLVFPWPSLLLAAWYALGAWVLTRTPTGPPPREAQAPAFDPVAAWASMDADVLAGVAMAEDAQAGEAVMWVLLNRARGERMLLEVALEPGQFGTITGGKFRPAWWPRRRWVHPLDRAALARLHALALEVLAGRVPDPTGGATHFHRVGTWVPPYAPPADDWSLHGSHAFYELEGV